MKKSLLIGMFLLLAIWAAGAVISINANGTGDYPTIQAAIDAADPNDIIVLQQGIYQGPGNRDLDYSGKPLTVQGTDPDNWDVVMSTVIDPQGTSKEPHRGFYFHSGETNRAMVDGITIRNGRAKHGGGIYCVQSAPKITRCFLERNGSEEIAFKGGSIYCRDSDLKIEDCVILTESELEDGSYIGTNRMILSQCVIIKDSIEGPSAGSSFVVLDSEEECISNTAPSYGDWVDFGRPDCWCYERNCLGDADGKREGQVVGGNCWLYDVSTNDLNTLVAGWQIKEPPRGPGINTISYNGIPGICADFARDAQGTALGGYARVSTNDLFILVAKWHVPSCDEDRPKCPLASEGGDIEFYTYPPL